MRQITVTGAGWLPAVAGLALLIATGCQVGSEPTGDAGGAPPEAAAGKATGETGAESAEQAPADEVELEFWRSVKDSEHTDELWAYLERYPKGAFADLAKAKIERLAKGPSEPSAPPVASAPVASAPVASAPTERRSRKQVVRETIRRKLARFSEPRVHLAPDIPRHKLDNAAQLHGFDASKVLMLYDDGFSGGGKTGFCLTDRKVYWRFVSGSPAYYLDYEDIDQVRVRKKKFLINGNEVSVTMANNPPRAAEVFAELLEELRDQLRRR